MFYSDRVETNGEEKIWWEIDSNGVCFKEMEFDNWSEPDNEKMHEHKPNQIVMQYTGLKDKNGKEIYEGDKVDYYGNSAEIIFLDNGGWWIKGYTNLSTNTKIIQVIGNIYEGVKK